MRIIGLILRPGALHYRTNTVLTMTIDEQRTQSTRFGSKLDPIGRFMMKSSAQKSEVFEGAFDKRKDAKERKTSEYNIV